MNAESIFELARHMARADEVSPSKGTTSSTLLRTHAAHAASRVAAKPLLASPTRVTSAATTGHLLFSASSSPGTTCRCLAPSCPETATLS